MKDPFTVLERELIESRCDLMTKVPNAFTHPRCRRDLLIAEIGLEIIEQRRARR